MKSSLICDGCGATISAATERRKGRVKHGLWQLENEAKRQGWIIVSRGAYYTQTHYCAKCCDEPMKPVPRKPRPKRG